MVAYHPLNVLVGTSGYSYKEWKGAFYPTDLKAALMLRFYAERFATVEINNTFYKMPTPEVLARWAAEVPAGFRFVLKAPRRITHEKRLAGASDTTARLFEVAASLGEKQGPFLFQLPPYSKKDTARLRDFLGLLPAGTRAAFEFRDPTWDDDEVREALRAGAPRCAWRTRTRTREIPAWCPPRASAICACGAPATTTTRFAPGPTASAPSPGTRPSCSSSTRTRPGARRWRPVWSRSCAASAATGSSPRWPGRGSARSR